MSFRFWIGFFYGFEIGSERSQWSQSGFRMRYLAEISVIAGASQKHSVCAFYGLWFSISASSSAFESNFFLIDIFDTAFRAGVQFRLSHKSNLNKIFRNLTFYYISDSGVGNKAIFANHMLKYI